MACSSSVTMNKAQRFLEIVDPETNRLNNKYMNKTIRGYNADGTFAWEAKIVGIQWKELGREFGPASGLGARTSGLEAQLSNKKRVIAPDEKTMDKWVSK